MRLAFSLLFISWLAKSQAPIIKEDFSSNHYGWLEDETKSISNEVYLINSTEEGDESLVTFFIDLQKDFTLSADFKQLGGKDDNGFGITWCSGKEDLNLFMVSSRGDYAIYSGNPEKLKSWKRSDAVLPLGNVNTLKIQSSGGSLSFFINGTKVEERKPIVAFGYSLGAIVFTEMKLVVDNFSLLQDQKIELPTTASPDKKENLAANINTVEDELGPVISTDGKTLLFARQNVPENTGGKDDDEDVYASQWINGAWSKAKNLGRAVNTVGTDNLLAVSADNNTLMFEEDNQLMMRHRSEMGWSELEKMGLTFTNELDHFVASLSADGRAVIFSAKLKSNVYYDPKRDDGDLYVCLKENDRWSAPINLGKAINSSGEETSPFLSSDGKTLYFSSNGRPGYGDQDIFMARKNGDSWTDWSNPVNLGPGINSPYFDAYYTVPASGDYAYFVSYDKGFGKADIFRVRLHDAVRPKSVTLVKGKVLSSKNNAPLTASVHFENIDNGTDMGEARTDPKTGAYQIILPFGFHYGVRASTKGYYSVHENLDLKEVAKYSEVTKDLLMVPIEIGETVKLNNVFFDPGQPTLKPASFPELDRLVAILKENTAIFIELEGHTDNLGKPAILQKLSEDRVESVKKYLIDHGIHGNRISGKGYGATKPIALGNTDEDRKLNRRVEFRIIKR
jgi:outer membrane protein OmpA-like peptidoglycan-associated protein